MTSHPHSTTPALVVKLAEAIDAEADAPAIVPPRPTSFTPAAMLEQQLRNQGFKPGTPPHLKDFARRIDQGIAHNQNCLRCGCVGQEYHPFYRQRSYRVIWACAVCGNGTEG